jgi:hypothetical protein
MMKTDAQAKTDANRVKAWLNSLPCVVYGFSRNSYMLHDECGNGVLNLDSPNFRFKNAYEIEAEIELLFDEGFDPGA